MLSVLSVTLPVFALILTGWLVRRAGVLGPHAASELTRFVIYLALPALLFEVVANAEWQVLWQPGFIGAFGLGVAVVFIGAVVVQLIRRRPLVDSAIDGLNAAYANTGFLGIPLLLAILGRDSLIPAMIATVITVCILFAVALIMLELALQRSASSASGPMLGTVGLQLLRNPLLVAPALGLLVLLLGLVAKNSILLVDLTNQLRAEGKAISEALLEACPIRLRPVLMTSLTVILALLPAALGFGAGADTNGPLSVAVIGGMITSTLLTLVVVPAVYSLMEGGVARLRQYRQSRGH